MRKNRFTLVVLGLTFGILFTGCEAASKKLIESENAKIETAQQELKHARTHYLAEWRKFNLETEQQMELNQKRIDAIKEMMVNAGPVAIKKYRKDMCALQRSNRELKTALEEFTYYGRAERKERSEKITMN